MSVYTFVRIVKGKRYKNSNYTPLTAHVLNREGVATTLNGCEAKLVIGSNGKQKTIYKNRFKDIPPNTMFWWRHDEIIPITEDDLPKIYAIEEQEKQERLAAIAKDRAEKIATGRFSYEIKMYNGKPSGELTREIISTDHTNFIEDLTDRITNSNDHWCRHYKNEYLPGRQPVLERLKRDEIFMDLINKAQKGDVLEYHEFNGGFCAAGGSWVITRDGNDQFHLNIWVS